MEGEHIYDCPNCNQEVDAMKKESQVQKKISYKCLSCGELTPKHKALRLMEKKDGKRRRSIFNDLDDNIDPFTGEKLVEKVLGNGWNELVPESKI